MSSFIRYTNLPVRIVADNGKIGADSLKFFLARQVSIQNSPAISQARIAGKTANPTDYTPTGNKDGTINMSLYLDGTEGIESIISNLIFSSDPQTLVIGETIFEYCYLDSLSFSLDPFTPVTAEMSFKAFQFKTPEVMPSIEVDTRLLDLANGAASQIILLNTDTGIEEILSGSFSFKITREPIFAPGQLVPIRVNLNSVELEIQIRCGSFGKFIDYRGRDTQIQFYVRTPSGTTCFTHENFTRGVDYLAGKCASQESGFEEGGYTTGTFNILSILF